MRLVFVYNAEAGIMAGIMDSIHKAVSPATYACSLCAITYGAFRMDPKWKAWLTTQPFETVFFHRPDFGSAYPGTHVDLPAILRDDAGTLTVLLGPADIAQAATVDKLICAIEANL